MLSKKGLEVEGFVGQYESRFELNKKCNDPPELRFTCVFQSNSKSQ